MLTHLPGSVFLNCGLYFSFRTTPCAAALQTAVSSPDPSCSLQGPAVGEQAHCLCRTLARDLALRSHMSCFGFHQAVASTFGHGVHPPEWHQRVGGATLQEPLERSVSSVEHVGVEKINPVLSPFHRAFRRVLQLCPTQGPWVTCAPGSCECGLTKSCELTTSYFFVPFCLFFACLSW